MDEWKLPERNWEKPAKVIIPVEPEKEIIGKWKPIINKSHAEMDRRSRIIMDFICGKDVNKINFVDKE